MRLRVNKKLQRNPERRPLRAPLFSKHRDGEGGGRGADGDGDEPLSAQREQERDAEGDRRLGEAVGGEEDGGHRHGREAGVGDVGEEGADRAVLDLPPEERERHRPDQVGDQAHRRDAEPDPHSPSPCFTSESGKRTAPTAEAATVQTMTAVLHECHAPWSNRS